MILIFIVILIHIAIAIIIITPQVPITAQSTKPINPRRLVPSHVPLQMLIHLPEQILILVSIIIVIALPAIDTHIAVAIVNVI